MRMKSKKSVSLIMVTALILAMLTACTLPSIPDVSATTQSAGGGTTQAEPEKPVTLKLYNVSFRHTEVSEDNAIVRELEKRTNTILDITKAPPEEAENKLNIALASGERPDIITFGQDATEFKLAEAGLLLPLNQYFEKMPDLKKSRSEEIWKAMTHDDGNIYCIPAATEASATFVTIYRKDWLDKFGLEIPDTIDEYYEVADAVSNKDPDGDGQKDTYAFSARGSLSTYFDHIFSAFGVLPQHFQEKDGKLVPGEIQPEAKEALKFLNKMYEAKMIDPEFTTNSSSRLKEKVNSGMFGAWHYGAYILDTENVFNNHAPFVEQNPDAQLVAGPLLKGPNGTALGYRQDTSIRGWIKDAIMKDSKNLDAVLRFVNYVASDEGVMLLNYGIEDEHYAVDANGVLRDLVKDGDKKKYLGINELVLFSKETYTHTSQVFKDTLKMLSDNSVMHYINNVSFDEKEKYWGDLRDIVTTNYFKMILGEIPIDGGFEAFVEEYNKSGGEELTKGINTVFGK